MLFYTCSNKLQNKKFLIGKNKQYEIFRNCSADRTVAIQDRMDAGSEKTDMTSADVPAASGRSEVSEMATGTRGWPFGGPGGYTKGAGKGERYHGEV